jgi:hypothetical protein
MVSEVYNWFTEGFDTKDLQKAKALLESLSRLAKRSMLRVMMVLHRLVPVPPRSGTGR